MKYVKRLLVLLLCCVLLNPAMRVGHADHGQPALDELQLYGSMEGQVTREFTVITGDGWFASREVYLELQQDLLTYASTNSPVLGPNAYMGTSQYCYPPLELKIWRWVQGTGWMLEQNYDVYNQPSHVIELEEKGTIYRIDVYFWRAQTVADSYIRHGIVPEGYGGELIGANWSNVGPCVTVTVGNQACLLEGDLVGID